MYHPSGLLRLPPPPHPSTPCVLQLFPQTHCPSKSTRPKDPPIPPDQPDPKAFLRFDFNTNSHLAVTESLSRPCGGGGGLFFRYFSLSNETIRHIFSSLLSSQSCRKRRNKNFKQGYHLNIVASAVHADALAIVTSELMGKTGAEL